VFLRDAVAVFYGPLGRRKRFETGRVDGGLPMSPNRPIKEFVKRKLNERGFYNIRDGRGLNERGFYDIRGIGEITTIDEFTERAFAISKRSRLQIQEDVIAFKKKYEEPIFGEIAVERLLEAQVQIIDPTNILMFTGSQLTHTLQGDRRPCAVEANRLLWRLHKRHSCFL
jgi:hypothetical protein